MVGIDHPRQKLVREAFRLEWISIGWMAIEVALVVVAGLIAQLAFGAWWIDSVTSLAIVWYLVKEGREAWQAESL